MKTCQRLRQAMVHLAHNRTAFALPNGTYGNPRMHRDLVGDGHRIGRHRTAWLMPEAGLVARQKRPFKWTTDSENAIARYIDGFHNPVRRHSSLGFLSPIALERRALEVR